MKCHSAAAILHAVFIAFVLVSSAAAQSANEQCAGCHKEIYERYKTTPMANASGPAIDGIITGEFTHPASGIHYRVYKKADAQGRQQVWLSYQRENAPAGRELNGEQQLEYFIGSGLRGRTYLFNKQGYWFEAPINWYGKKKIWDMAPNYLNAKSMPMTLEVDPGCLRCHTSNAAHSLPDARNHYAAAPFAESGITCTACHGDASAHLASGGKTPMLNIDKLKPVRRDSICLDCHLEGQTAVVRQGKELVDFTPGDDLFDYALFFVRNSVKGSGGRATSQWEALEESECKRKSGDNLTCTTCHDPHGSPAPQEKVAYYRAKCLQCHSQNRFAETHHTENQDCVGCHMARSLTIDIAHDQVTDHRIVKHPATGAQTQMVGVELRAIGGQAATDRDLGIAYAHMSRPGDVESPKRAFELLKSAEAEQDGAPFDHELHDQLGFLLHTSGDAEGAADEYRKALKADANDSFAAGNLAVIEAQHHHPDVAIKLLQKIADDDPAETRAALNLAILECQSRMRSQTLATLQRLLLFEPDQPTAQEMRIQIINTQQACQPK